MLHVWNVFAIPKSNNVCIMLTSCHCLSMVVLCRIHTQLNTNKWVAECFLVDTVIAKKHILPTFRLDTSVLLWVSESEAETRSLAIYQALRQPHADCCLHCARVQSSASRLWMGVCGVHASPAPQFLVCGDRRKARTIEALALWFRSNAQRFLHDQLHGLPGRSRNRSSFVEGSRIPVLFPTVGSQHTRN